MRISEVYLSTQGEGPNVGKRTCFVRFGGCNLRCPGWPCDTPFAVDPKEFRHTWTQVAPDVLAGDIIAECNDDTDVTICFTGGEPMLQPTRELEALITALQEHGFYKLEMFSNGTIEYTPAILSDVIIIMDWKLPGSGEDPYNGVRKSNLARMSNHHAVKFVCKDREDYKVAIAIYNSLIKGTYFHPEVYYGVVWGGELQAKEIVGWVLEDGLDWRLNLQSHNLIWPAHERAR